MKIIGEKLSNKALLLVKGGCDITCYCESVYLLICNENPQGIPLWNQYNCPTGNQGDPGYPGSGGQYDCAPIDEN